MEVNPSTIVPLIQLAISPVILISGEGAFMLMLTNRMGRVVDRTRTLAGKLREAEANESQHVDSQLTILWRRAKLLRSAVTLCGLSMSVACSLVLLILVDALLEKTYPLLMVSLFSLAVVLLGAALVTFLRDIFVALDALHLEVVRARSERQP
jgi:hypothetical protein